MAEQGTGIVKFCSRCGTAHQQGAAFCTGCGHPLSEEGPVQEVSRPARRWRRVWIAFGLLAVLTLSCAAVSGFAYGLVMGPGPGVEIPSSDQQDVIAQLGDPSAWFVGDGPLKEDAEFARLEVWIYPDAGMYYEFVDGVLAEELEVTFSEEFDIAGAVPVAFDRSMRQADVEEMLGEVGLPLTMDDPAEGLDPFIYPSSRLTIAYLDGWFYIAQTY